MESKSSAEAGQKYPDIVAKIKSREVTTLVINENRLPSYLNAGSETGFKVTKIAGEGEEFPLLIKEGMLMKREDVGLRLGEIIDRKVEGKGYIAVAIEKPAGSMGDLNPFWRKLDSLEQREVYPPPKKKSTAKS